VPKNAENTFLDDRNIKSARGKLKRAASLLDELDRLRGDYLTEFLASVVQHEVQVMEPDGEWTVTLMEQVPEVPDEIANIAGDAMHNVRSALDHVACACVVSNGNAVTKQNAFPIRSKRPGGKKPIPFDTLPAVKGMGAKHIKAIENLQPYANPGTPETRKLIQLAVFDNADKHVVDILTFPTCTGPLQGAKILTDRPLKKNEFVESLVYEGRNLLKHPEVVRIKAPPDSHGWIPLECDLAFVYPRVQIRELREIRAYVVGIVESFGPILDGFVP
jgi:hypothetical protein